MPSVDQPTGLAKTNACVITLGYVCNNDRCAITLPMATDTDINPNDGLQQLADNLATVLVTPWADCVSSATYCSFVACESMNNGVVPARVDFAPADHPGTRGATSVASQVAGLMVFYEDSRDVSGTEKIRVGKNFISGIATDDVVGDELVADLQANIVSLAESLQNGIDDGDGNTWYRVLAREGIAGPQIRRTYSFASRGYVVTQRRRLIPR